MLTAFGAVVIIQRKLHRVQSYRTALAIGLVLVLFLQFQFLLPLCRIFISYLPVFASLNKLIRTTYDLSWL